MTSAVKSGAAALPSPALRAQDRDHPLIERLIDRLPDRIQAPTRWLRLPSSRWARVPAGVLLVGGGFLAILPLLGLWMLPLGLLLLAEDVAALRRARNRILERIALRRPHWFGADQSTPSSDPRPPAPAASPDTHA
jgi:hypothetical protein